MAHASAAAVPDTLLERDDVLDYGRKIAWRKYVEAGAAPARGAGAGDGDANLFLTDADVYNLRMFGDENPEAMAELLATSEEGAASGYARTLVKVASNVADTRVLRYVLTLADDLLSWDAAARLPLFEWDGRMQSGPFLRLLSTSTDAYVQNKAAHVAAYLVAHRPTDASAGASTLLAWVLRHLQAASSGAAPEGAGALAVLSATSALMVLMRAPPLRELFVREHGVERLVPLLASTNVQLCYEVAFSLWAVAMHEPARPVMLHSGAVRALQRAARVDAHQKVLRMAIGAIAAVVADAEVGPAAADLVFAGGMPATLKALVAERKLKDEELLRDIEALRSGMEGAHRHLNALERYLQELEGGLLEWGPLHTPEFWKEHARAMEARDFAPLRRLGAMLDGGSDDATTVAVALFDLGEFGRHHPHGQLVLERMGLKAQAMARLESSDLEVRKQALLAVSKLMVTSWQFIRE